MDEVCCRSKTIAATQDWLCSSGGPGFRKAASTRPPRKPPSSLRNTITNTAIALPILNQLTAQCLIWGLCAPMSQSAPSVVGDPFAATETDCTIQVKHPSRKEVVRCYRQVNEGLEAMSIYFEPSAFWDVH
ncbi:hypothetical protein SUNI508_02100 [Seiridium unicorne]|uniref:Uncharacterized protein n=1 Tax=Seiridium unicorne TaxID=138068 RepID=A0ABR2UKW2_9PEZI